jgi:Zn-dependent protease
MPELSIIQQIAVWILPILFAITFHEAAHAYVAYSLGDMTAKQLGRLSLNPVNHIDMFGSIFVPIVTLVISNFSFVFGWAKPVPINVSYFANPRRDLALATAAGPLANILMAVFWAAVMKIGFMIHPQASMLALFMVLAAKAGVIINLVLAFLNLLPIPPLDGSKIVMALLSARQAFMYQKLEPFGLLILLALLFLGILNWLISPAIRGSLVLLRSLFNL